MNTIETYIDNYSKLISRISSKNEAVVFPIFIRPTSKCFLHANNFHFHLLEANCSLIDFLIMIVFDKLFQYPHDITHRLIIFEYCEV